MLKVKELHKRYTTDRGDVKAVTGVSFEVQRGEFFTLLGPSGCGKSTTIRCIAGLEKPEAGEITIGDTVVFSGVRNKLVPANQRDIAMVFQSYAIWPNMTVFRNAAYPLEGKLPKAAVRERVMEVLRSVGIEHLADRPAPQLSGGQQQRVALARAIVKGAKVLLLDEPLSNLDAKLRAQMRVEIRNLQKQFDITAIYVTHDQEEALSLSDRVAVMNEGRIIEINKPATIYRQPSILFSAEFIGACNLLTGIIAEGASGGERAVHTALGSVACAVPLGVSGRVVVCVRPEHVEVWKTGTQARTGQNVFEGTVSSASFLGRFFDCVIRVMGEDIKVQAPSLQDLAAGDRVSLYFPPKACTAIAEN